MERLLSEQIPKVEVLRRQLSSCHVRVLDSFGSLGIEVQDNESIWDVDYDGPLATAYQKDEDTADVGPFINFILFVCAGKLKELQIYKDDGSTPKLAYNPANFVLVSESASRSRLK